MFREKLLYTPYLRFKNMTSFASSSSSSFSLSLSNEPSEIAIKISNSSDLELGNKPIENEISLDDNSKNSKKEAKKLAKSIKRMKREGNDPSVGQKPCDICAKKVDLLIRCQIDVSQAWHMVCGKCWNGVSGGVTDGDANHPHYKYGGLWKNR